MAEDSVEIVTGIKEVAQPLLLIEHVVAHQYSVRPRTGILIDTPENFTSGEMIVPNSI